MDNNNNEDPVFTSTQIKDTKSRSSGDYFKNVQKASLWQKITTSYAKYRNDSIERQKNNAEASRAKRAKKRAEADLRAMSVNIPTAAENGNPALMNTHYAPPPRAKANPLVIAGLALVAAGLIAGIVILIVNKVSEPEPTLPTVPVYTFDDEEDEADYEDEEESEDDLGLSLREELGLEQPDSDTLLSFNVAKSDYRQGSAFMKSVVEASGLEALVSGENGKLDPAASAARIDEIIAAVGMIDPDQLLLFEIEKARLYITAGDYATGYTMLSKLDEAKLNNCQLGLYYNAIATYYKLSGNEDEAATYISKLDRLPHVSTSDSEEEE